MDIILSDIYNSQGVKSYKDKNYYDAAFNFIKSISEAEKEKKNSSNLAFAIYNLAFTYKEVGDENFNTFLQTV